MVLPIQAAIEGLKSLTTPFIQPLFIPVLYLMLQSLGTILTVWLNGDQVQDEKEFRGTPNPRGYDFIIVGAGSAGSLLANRLSRTYTVLLLEAGGEPNPLQFIPGFGLFLIGYPQIDWNHRSIPQKFGSLMSANGEAAFSAGKGLGGSGNLNLMIHLRGHRKDFDNWARITGDPTWSWEGVLPYFKQYEDYHVPGDNVNHGYRGELRVETPDFIGNARHFVKAGLELGYPNVDLNAPFEEGFDVFRYPTRRGTRQAPYKAFLEPVRHRKTLTIMKYAQVNRVLFREGNVAYGVEYDRHGRTYTAHARREVIVSAGTVGTSKILLFSGVGPKAHLDSLNIPVVSDVPVGENLQDHLGVYLGPFFIKEGLGTYLDRDLTPSQFVKWFTLGKGRLSSTGCEATGIFSSELAKARGEGDWPDLHILLYSFTNYRYGPELISNAFNLKLDELRRYFGNSAGRDSVYIAVSGARPFSRGYVRLGGSSAYDKPIIEPNYLGDEGETDLKVLVDGIKKTMFLMENTTAGGIDMGARFTTTPLPGCEHFPFRSDEYWACFARRFSVTLHHPAGTAAMGTVVDTELRVIGTSNLRVVDASVQPVVVVTNTQASTLMIAEKASDLILRFWNQVYPPYQPKSKLMKLLDPLFGILGKKKRGYSKFGQHPHPIPGPVVIMPAYADQGYFKRRLDIMDNRTSINYTTTTQPPVSPLAPTTTTTQKIPVFEQDNYAKNEVDSIPTPIKYRRRPVSQVANHLQPIYPLKTVPVLQLVKEAAKDITPISPSKSELSGTGQNKKEEEYEYYYEDVEDDGEEEVKTKIEKPAKAPVYKKPTPPPPVVLRRPPNQYMLDVLKYSQAGSNSLSLDIPDDFFSFTNNLNK